MNIIKKITFLVLVTILFCQCEINPKDEIPEGNVNIPDITFLEVLIDEGIDTNNDGQISYAEAYEVISLSFEGDVCLMCEGWCASRLDIKSLEGIQAFVNLRRLSFSCTKIEHLNLPNLPKLTELFCMSDTLKSLDISKCTALRKLTLGFSQLTSINVSNNKDLEDFICHNNQLTTIDITKNTNLKFLDCSGNKLTKIDVTNNTALEDLRCSFNQITTIDVSHNTKLRNLDCCYNKLTLINLTQNSALIFIECSNNQLTTIDVTHIRALLHLSCSNNSLTSLDISHNSALTKLYVSDMPSLNKICVWEMPFPPPEVEIYTEGSPNVYFTLDCN